MRVNGEGALVLTSDETMALAADVAARHLEDVETWLEWEDLPQLTAEGFNLVCASVRLNATSIAAQLKAFERSSDVDVYEVRERATA